MPGMQMERPPMPPDVQAQMGGGGKPPFSDVGGMMADKQVAGNPLKSAIDMTEKLWTNVVKASPKMGPYVARAMDILKSGMSEAAGSKDSPQQSEGGGGPVPAGPGPGAMPA